MCIWCGVPEIPLGLLLHSLCAAFVSASPDTAAVSVPLSVVSAGGSVSEAVSASSSFPVHLWQHVSVEGIA